jgi:serine/threonine protein kinase
MKDQDQTQRDRQARDIFLRAVELQSREAQAAYIEGACQHDASLRSRVDALLENHRKDSFLEVPAIDKPTVLSATPLSESPGTTIDRYKLLQQIGEGGMGVVYMAEQEEPVRRRVALKIIKLGMDTRQVVARFEAERQALAMMDHPNIARVFDGGATEHGRPYFVMELVRGIPVTTWCDARQLTTRDRLELFITICQAVQHAHQKGIIHRDLKPSNILVTEQDGRAMPKVIDFGIAKATEQELTDKTFEDAVTTIQQDFGENLTQAKADLQRFQEILVCLFRQIGQIHFDSCLLG